jgi:ATP synthase regulation protein NCA2
MSPISLEYEKELRRPIQNILSGRLARLMLIQVIFFSFTKCNFHVLNHFLLIYTCKLHWNSINSDTAPVCQKGITGGYASHRRIVQRKPGQPPAACDHSCNSFRYVFLMCNFICK